MALSLSDMAATYVRLRDMIAEDDKNHKETMAPKRQALNDLNALLLGKLQGMGVDSFKSPSGTVYVTTRRSATIQDVELFWEFVVKQAAWDLVDKKANAPAVSDYVEQFKNLPPGVSLTTTEMVGVRRS